jgi:hypothetical protein
MVENVIHYRNNEFLETTLYSYVFVKGVDKSSFSSKHADTFPKMVK